MEERWIGARLELRADHYFGVLSTAPPDPF